MVVKNTYARLIHWLNKNRFFFSSVGTVVLTTRSKETMQFALLLFSVWFRGKFRPRGGTAWQTLNRFVFLVVAVAASAMGLTTRFPTATTTTTTFHEAVTTMLYLGGSEAVTSRVQTAQCALQVSVGRIPGTAMPEDWAASGAKLGFELEVEFCKEPCADYEMTKERLVLGGSAAAESTTTAAASRRRKPDIKAVEPLNNPTFVSTLGTQEILVTEGAYGCDLQNPQSQQYAFRFFLDFPEGAQRNDVTLPAERIYFMTSCWIRNEAALERARNQHRELRETLRSVEEEMLSLDSSSSSLLDKVLGLRKMTLCVEKKKAVEDQLENLERAYPLQEPGMVLVDNPNNKRREFLEGPNGLLFVKNGVIAVKRFRGIMDTREQYHWVGTFSITEFFEDLEVDDDDDDDNDAATSRR